LRNCRPTSSADSRVGVDLARGGSRRPGLRHQALKDAAGQEAHQDDAHALFVGLADHPLVILKIRGVVAAINK
jgi:hypothetical protein